MITRRDWWIGVGLIVLALLAHALLPRYEWRTPTERAAQAHVLTRVDRWTGQVVYVQIGPEIPHEE